MTNNSHFDLVVVVIDVVTVHSFRDLNLIVAESPPKWLVDQLCT